MKMPVIGIAGTANPAPSDSAFPNFKRIFTNEGYVSSLENVGAAVLLIPVTNGPLEQLVKLCDGILFPGGLDIEPSLYNTTRTPLCGKSDVQTDRFQIALFHEARKQGKPILGICRGVQLINVASGGTLFQDYTLREGHTIDHPHYDNPGKSCHCVNLAHDSFLSSWFGTSKLGVNSLHHQCLDRVAPGMRISATCDDGSIEAVEAAEGTFLVGVQWHPEAMQSTMQPLFSAFVKEASKQASIE